MKLMFIIIYSFNINLYKKYIGVTVFFEKTYLKYKWYNVIQYVTKKNILTNIILVSLYATIYMLSNYIIFISIQTLF